MTKLKENDLILKSIIFGHLAGWVIFNIVIMVFNNNPELIKFRQGKETGPNEAQKGIWIWSMNYQKAICSIQLAESYRLRNRYITLFEVLFVRLLLSAYQMLDFSNLIDSVYLIIISYAFYKLKNNISHVTLFKVLN